MITGELVVGQRRINGVLSVAVTFALVAVFVLIAAVAGWVVFRLWRV